MKDWLSKVEEAKKELTVKSIDQIQQETAIKWAARYTAAIDRICKLQVETDEEIVKYHLEANEYRSEALEHAAQVKDEMFYATIRMLIG